MRHNKSLNKLYYDIVLKEDIDDRPFFIMQYEDGFLVFQDRFNIIKKFCNYKIAEMYVNQKYYHPQIITIDFRKKIKKIHLIFFETKKAIHIEQLIIHL